MATDPIFTSKNNNDVIRFEEPEEGTRHVYKQVGWRWSDDYGSHGNDMVNSPAHYTRGKTEVIEIIEDAIKDAPSVKDGMLQAQVLKYMLRLWLKSDCKEDAEKARWYLNRLIDSLN